MFQKRAGATKSMERLSSPVWSQDLVNEAAFEYYARLNKLRRYVEDHYSEDLSLRKAAQLVGLEKKYFSVVFGIGA